MKGADLFGTTIIYRQVRKLFELAPNTPPLTRTEVINLLKLKDRPKPVRVAISHMIKKGILKDTPEGLVYTPPAKLPNGEKADRVWRYIRYKGIFTIAEVTKITEVSRNYVQQLMRGYVKKGIVKVVYRQKHTLFYTLVDKSRKARP